MKKILTLLITIMVLSCAVSCDDDVTPKILIFSTEPTDPDDLILRSVDLGLTSGTLWANMNVGAKTVYESGSYFAWGETQQKSNYSSSNYGGNNYDELPYYYDAARAIMGSGWQMPTKDQIKELVNECNWTWTSKNGADGYQVKSRINGNSIFLPVGGYRDGNNIYNRRKSGEYWSRSRYYSGYAYQLHFVSSSIRHDYSSNCYQGMNIRAVRAILAITGDVEDITESSAYISGTVDSSALPASYSGLSFGVEYSPYESFAQISRVSASNYSFRVKLSSLSSQTTYYYRTYLEIYYPSGSKEKFQGETRQFKTGALRRAIDLGLTSGTLWANMNVGASSPEDYGSYFVWGATQAYPGQTSSATDYELPVGRDAAYVNWGSDWRMPTANQMKELASECYIYWRTQAGKNGILFQSKKNGNSIFLPAVGYIYSGSQYSQGTSAYYWSRNRGSSYAYALYFNSTGVTYNYSTYTSYGCAVRPVLRR